MTMSAADFLDQWFETDVLKATMSASGIIGTFLGVGLQEQPTYFCITTWARSTERIVHGALCVAEPVRFRTQSQCGERSGCGDSNGIASSENPYRQWTEQRGSCWRTAMRSGKSRLVQRRPALDVHKVRRGPEHLPTDFVEDVRRYKYRGSSGKVNLALASAAGFYLSARGPVLTCVVQYRSRRVLEYMERAYDDAKYGRFSRQPYIDIVIPSLTDPSVAPAGKHVMSCFVQYAPYHLKEGTWDEKREEFGDTVIDTHCRIRSQHEGDHSAPAGFDPIGHRKAIRTLPKETSSRANCRWNNCSSCARFLAGPSIGRPCATCTCVALRHIPAAASWARRA